jgi:hypothetical protein
LACIIVQALRRLARANILEFFILDTRATASTSRHNQFSYSLAPRSGISQILNSVPRYRNLDLAPN